MTCLARPTARHETLGQVRSDDAAGPGSDRPLTALLRPELTRGEFVALMILLLGAVALTVVVWWRGRPVPLEPPAEVASEELSIFPATEGPAGEGGSTILVHVAGAVARPGVMALPDGARIDAAIDAAGGALPGARLEALNLARPLRDGEQVLVPAAGENRPPADAGPSPSRLPDGRLDLNAATRDDLEQIPGVGPVTAQRILQHRDQLGGFSDVSQLLEVRGIGPATFAAIEPEVGV